jgi:hypothetical protein
MLASFSETKELVLIELYRAIHDSDDAEYFSVSDIKESASLRVGGAFIKKALDALTGEGLVLSEYFDVDEEYGFTLTGKGLSSGERAVAKRLDHEQGLRSVPASDRIVTLTHNQKSEISLALEEISEQLATSNEIGESLGETKELIVSEVSAAKTLVSTGKFRLNTLFNLLSKPLSFLSEKFTGAAVGELAKRLLTELWKLLS